MKLQKNAGIEKLFMKSCVHCAAHKKYSGLCAANKYDDLISVADDAKNVAFRDALYALGYTPEMVSDIADAAEKAFYANGSAVDAAADYIDSEFVEGFVKQRS